LKTTNHLYFQYNNAASNLLVSLTEFNLTDDTTTYKVSTLVGELHQVLSFDTLSEALQVAEQKLRLMLQEYMVPIYLEHLTPKDE